MNLFFVGGVTDLVKEQEFIEQCMEGLVQASEELEQVKFVKLVVLGGFFL